MTNLKKYCLHKALAHPGRALAADTHAHVRLGLSHHRSCSARGAHTPGHLGPLRWYSCVEVNNVSTVCQQCVN